MPDYRYLLTRETRCETCAGTCQLAAAVKGAAPVSCPTCSGRGWHLAQPVPLAEGLTLEPAFTDLVGRVAVLEKKPK